MGRKTRRTDEKRSPSAATQVISWLANLLLILISKPEIVDRWIDVIKRL